LPNSNLNEIHSKYPPPLFLTREKLKILTLYGYIVKWIYLGRLGYNTNTRKVTGTFRREKISDAEGELWISALFPCKLKTPT
jgi:hypothetical protein